MDENNSVEINATAKMAALLRELRTEMNGAVAGSMAANGIIYPLNYGVSIHVIRKIAKQYAPDHELANLLYLQDIRELKIAAVTIAEPEKVSSNDSGFWASGIINTEIASILASGLICASLQAEDISTGWLRAPEPLLKYTGLMALTARLRQAGLLQTDKLLGIIAEPAIIASPEAYIHNAAANFLASLSEYLPEHQDTVRKIITLAKENGYPSAQILHSETEWILQEP